MFRIEVGHIYTPLLNTKHFSFFNFIIFSRDWPDYQAIATMI
jgi:hypothetical protein